jgi:hypothetical protein
MRRIKCSVLELNSHLKVYELEGGCLKGYCATIKNNEDPNVMCDFLRETQLDGRDNAIWWCTKEWIR